MEDEKRRRRKLAFSASVCFAAVAVLSAVQPLLFDVAQWSAGRLASVSLFAGLALVLGWWAAKG